MKIAKQIIAGSFILILLMAVSEMAVHAVVHHGSEHHHEDVHHCDDHDHGMEEESSICSHEHQCELCVLIQATTTFLPQAETTSAYVAKAEVRSVYRAEFFTTGISSVCAPRGPPQI